MAPCALFGNSHKKMRVFYDIYLRRQTMRIIHKNTLAWQSFNVQCAATSTPFVHAVLLHIRSNCRE